MSLPARPSNVSLDAEHSGAQFVQAQPQTRAAHLMSHVIVVHKQLAVVVEAAQRRQRYHPAAHQVPSTSSLAGWKAPRSRPDAAHNTADAVTATAQLMTRAAYEAEQEKLSHHSRVRVQLHHLEIDWRWHQAQGCSQKQGPRDGRS